MASIRLARNVPRSNCFEVVSSSPGGGLRIMVLQAESDVDMNHWIKAVTAGISAQLETLLPSSVSGTGGGGKNSTGHHKSKGGNSEGDVQRERQLKVITETKGNNKCADCNTLEGKSKSDAVSKCSCSYQLCTILVVIIVKIIFIRSILF